MDVRVYRATGRPAMFAKEPNNLGSFFYLGVKKITRR
jgi:hypothetical protein